MIIISDGDPSPPSAAIIRDLVQQNVTVTTVDVAQPQHAPGGALLLQRIARQTGGKYYAIASASALPRIYQREVRRIARPLVYEPKPPVSPIVTTDHEIVQGLGISDFSRERMEATDTELREERAAIEELL